MNIIDEIKLALKIKSTVNEVETDIKMKNATKAIVSVISLLTVIASNGSIQAMTKHFLSTHETVALIVSGLVSILLTLHVPTDPNKVSTDSQVSSKALPMLFIVALLFISLPASAQTVTTPPPGAIYAAGVSYSVGAIPAVAGTGLFAYPVAGTSTYAFTTLDVLPNTMKPLTVVTNTAVGVGQLLTTYKSFPIYCTTGAGPSWTGTNVGWSYNFGCLTEVTIKGQRFMPTVRALKSSVSGGTGFQPIIGILYHF